MSQTNRKPVAVLISDVHFSLSNLEPATSALVQAQDKAGALGVPLVIAGDLNDTKAILRGEVANRLISLLREGPETLALVGNHDLLNEKGEDHALNFLKPYVEIIDEPTDWPGVGHLIPYFSDGEALKAHLKTLHPGYRLIMHQGVVGADLGHYVKDESALPPEVFADFRVISGHYHKAQDIKCGRPRRGAVGLFSYIGSPYTMTFGEANDGPKGFRVLYDDGTLESIPTNLRKHVIAEIGVTVPGGKIPELAPGDLLWLKVRGPRIELEKVRKQDLAKIIGTANFKLEKIPTDAPVLQVESQKHTGEELMDKLIDATDEAAKEKKALKKLWREVT